MDELFLIAVYWVWLCIFVFIFINYKDKIDEYCFKYFLKKEVIFFKFSIIITQTNYFFNCENCTIKESKQIHEQ